MPAADPAFGWEAAVAMLAIVVVAAFLVTWVVTDLARVRRVWYVGILTITAVTLMAVSVAWSGVGVSDLVTDGWGWGVLAGVIAAALLAPAVRRLSPHPHPRGARLVGVVLWEGVVYGVAEALLLATLPVLAVWQAASDLGWTDGAPGRWGSGALAVVAALGVILVHHLGYAEFRAPAARTKLGGALLACGFQALAFLLTGNVLAPIVAHVLLHAQMILRGVELPPVEVV